MRETIRLIGKSIKDGAKFLPIRNHAAALATKAPPKDYLGQVNKIYESFVKNWRYVKDPFGQELVTTSPSALYNLVIGGGPKNPGLGYGKGAGDCDDATAALGAQLRAIGFPVRIAVTSNPGSRPGPFFHHVFAQASIPGVGWLTVDPVPYPVHGFGYTPAHSRIAFYDLDANLLGYRGNVKGLHDNEEVIEMYNGLGAAPDLTLWEDLGLAGTEDHTEPLLDWRKYVLKDFGAYADQYGMMSGEGLGLSAEVEMFRTPSGDYVARTPMLELSPEDYQWMRERKFPYHGMLALGDEGEIYRYDTLGGFFKRLFKKAKKLVKKVVKKVGGAAKKLLKKIPGGKYLVKLGEKIWKTATKFVKPLIKFVGKYAAKLAPVAALIPGYGPAISAALYTAGKVAKLMDKYGVQLIGEKGKARKLKFKSGDSAKDFQKALKKAAKDQEKHEKRKHKAKRDVIRRQRVSRRTIPRGFPRSYSRRFRRPTFRPAMMR